MKLLYILSWWITTIQLLWVNAEIHELNEENLESATSVGVHLVEFYSPKCHHCKEFMPIYEDVDRKTEDLQKANQIVISRIDCLKYSKYCQEKWKIRGFPTLHLIIDGKFDREFKDSREAEKLLEFIKKHAKTTEAQEKGKKSLVPESDVDDSLKLTQLQPLTKLLLSPFQENIVDKDGSVITLTTDSFRNTIKRGAFFIKFYAPWCGHCKTIEPIWNSLADMMKGKMNIAQVNGDVEKKLMSDYDIKGFPTLMYFENGILVDHYSGSRSLSDLAQYCDKTLSSPFLKIDSAKELDGYRKVNDVVILYVADEFVEKLDKASMMLEVARYLRDSAVFLVSNNKDLAREYGFDSLTAFRTNALRGSAVSKLDFSNVEKRGYLEAWIKDKAKVAVIDVNTKNAEAVLEAKNQLLVLAIYVSRDDWIKSHREKYFNLAKTAFSSEALEAELGTNSRGLKADVRFATLNGKLYANYVKNVFGFDVEANAGKVKLVIVETERKIFYETDKLGNILHVEDDQNVIMQAIVDASEYRLAIKSMQGSAHTFVLEGFRQIKSSSLILSLLFISAFFGVYLIVRNRKTFSALFEDPEAARKLQ